MPALRRSAITRKSRATSESDSAEVGSSMITIAASNGQGLGDLDHLLIADPQVADLGPR